MDSSGGDRRAGSLVLPSLNHLCEVGGWRILQDLSHQPPVPDDRSWNPVRDANFLVEIYVVQ